MLRMHGSLLLTTVLAVLSLLIEASDDEYRLIHYLFSEQDYNPLIRPTLYSNETLVVSFGLLLVQIIHVKRRSWELSRMFSRWLLGFRKRTGDEVQHLAAYEMVCAY